ncbi:AbgT family transporter [Escherichia coli]|nr:AbgT family transporter [Escherichia coli]
MKVQGLAASRRLSVWRCFPLSYACLLPAVPQSGRFWPPIFRTNVYATWLSPGICANPLSYCRLIRIAFSAGISLLFHCFLDSCNALQTRRETGYLLFVSLAPIRLSFLVVWLLMLLAWYLVGLPIGPGIYPRLS